jgi:hypothetical protein
LIASVQNTNPITEIRRGIDAFSVCDFVAHRKR